GGGVRECGEGGSAHAGEGAICPTAAAAWLPWSFGAPAGSLSTERPSAIAPDETTSTSRRSLCSPAISVASDANHSRFNPPAEESTRSEEPTFTTMRRKSLSDGAFCTVPTELFM